MSKPLALIIEDDPQLSRVFMLALDDIFETVSIADGALALAHLAEVVPHLVVLDINLPGVSGVEILKAIRADKRIASTRVILATADPRQANELQDLADLVLLKPVSVMQLRDLATRLR